MESRTVCDTENVAEKIIYNMNPKQLIEVRIKVSRWTCLPTPTKASGRRDNPRANVNK